MSNVNEALDTMWTDWLVNSFDDVFVYDEEDDVPGLVVFPVKIKAFVRTPAFSEDVAEVFAGLSSIGDLVGPPEYPDSVGRPEWVEAHATPVFTSGTEIAYLRKREDLDDCPISLEAGFSGGIDRAYIEDGIGWTFTSDDDVQDIVTAVVFYFDGTVEGVEDPIIFATTQGCGVSTVVHENSLFGVAQSYVGLGNPADLLTVSNTNSTFAARHVLLDPGLPPWEGAHTQHLWIEPQRVNLIANPAFQCIDEADNVFGWRSSPETTLTRVAGGIDTWRDTKYCLEVSGSIQSKKLESNFFPNVSEWYSGSFSISTSTPATFRCGIVAFDATYTKPRYVVSNYASVGSTDPDSQGFLRVQFLAKMFPDAADLCFRLEIEGGTFDNPTTICVSNVLIDPHPGQYDYFDGACTRGAAGDFRWMGGEDDRHFSLWYNNYRNTKNRIVGGYDPTDEVYKPGLVEEWAPTGSNIRAHWDAVTSITPQNWSGDAYYTLADVGGSETTTVSDEYNFDLSARRETGYVPYVLDTDGQLLLDTDGSVFL